MPSTYTTRNRAEKQAPGENLDSWGSRLNGNTIDMFDQALDGVLSLTVSGSVTLSTANGSSDQARYRVLNITGTGGTVTIPNVEKAYFVYNGTSGTVTFTTGSGTSAAVVSGAAKWIFSTGSNVVLQASGPAFGSMAVTGGSFLASAATGGVGYATGAGGAITQFTSKSTDVTLNTICGQITTHGAALASATEVIFAFVNSNITTLSTIILTQSSTGVDSFYNVRVVAAANGACTIGIKNITGGSRSDPVVLNFAIVKAVSS